jgi:HEAT repeat protein
LRSLQAVLVQADARQGDRDEAAARLVSRGTPQADEILRDAIINGPRDARLAVARAVIDDPTPAVDLITPLSDLLRLGADQRPVPTLVDAAAQALASYRRVPEAVDELIRFALDGAQPAEARARVVRALGRVVDPAAADLLVRLVRTERGALRAAAAEALADLTGIRDNGQDANRWAQWQRNSAALAAQNPDRWRAELLEARAANLDRLRRRREALVEALDARMLAQYQEAARQQRGSDVLLAMLNSELPDEREQAARLVTRAFQNQDPVSERVRDRLVALVGDSDADVRYAVAVTLTNLNHRGALAAELTQLAQERDERVKIALCEALGKIEDPVAAPLLAALLSDPSPRVFAAAAGALSRVARDLRGAGDLPPQTLRLLTQAAANRAGVSESVRIAAIDALGALRAPDFVELAQRLLFGPQADPSVQVRQATLRALGAVGNPAATDIITRALREDRDPGVRSAAVDALGRVGNLPEHGSLLLDYTSPRNEPEEEVRRKAWEAYQALLQRATTVQLTSEQNNLKGDPVRRAVVLEELCRKLEQSPAPQDKAVLAFNRENLGDVYMSLKPPEPGKAAPNLRRALDYFVQNGAQENVTTPLIGKVIDAYLRSKDYAQAARFAEQTMTREPAQSAEMGRLIKQEADRLRSPTVNDTRGAIQLIDEAMKMNPSLEPRHRDDLRQIRQDIESAQ